MNSATMYKNSATTDSSEDEDIFSNDTLTIRTTAMMTAVPSSLSMMMMTETMMTTTSDVEYYPPVKQPLHMIVIYTFAYLVVFVLSVVGNSLVVAVVWRNTQMHNVTNYFIVNLAVADILVSVFCLPITLMSNLLSGWPFGAVMCKMAPFLQGVSVCASVSTLAAISFDRYLAICRIMEFRLTRKVARLVIVLIWVCAAAIMAPWLVYYRQQSYTTTVQTMYVCAQFWPSESLKKGYFLGVIFLTCYTVPLMLISVFYSLISCRVWNRESLNGSAGMTTSSTSSIIYRSKVKVLKMLIVVVILFALSWLPLYGVNMRIYFGQTDVEDVLMQIVVPIAQWLGSSNSCVNPIIYCLFSKKYRSGIRRLLSCSRSPPLCAVRRATTGISYDGSRIRALTTADSGGVGGGGERPKQLRQRLGQRRRLPAVGGAKRIVRLMDNAKGAAGYESSTKWNGVVAFDRTEGATSAIYSLSKNSDHNY